MQAVLQALRGVDLLDGVDEEALERIAENGQVLEVPAERYVIRQGEYGDTFYVLLNGRMRVEIIGEDGVPQPVGELKEGQYFGELAVLGKGERIASVKSTSAARLFELRAAEFEGATKKFKQVRSRLEAVFLKKSLDTFIRQSRYFRDLPADTRQLLIDSSSLSRHSKGDVLVEEGEAAQHLFIVRSGFVRISRKVKREAEMVDEILAYLGPEDFFGDQEVSVGSSYATTAVALEPVECVRVPRSAVWKLYLKHPDVFNAFRRYQLTRTRQQQDVVASNTAMGFVRDMLEAGLGQARSALIINMDACVRCGNCVQACDDLHGFSRLTRRGKKMTRRVEIESTKHENLYFPTSCLQCSAPECMVGCPTGAIARDVGGEVYIKDTCIGCGNCARNCDFGNIQMAKLDRAEPSILDLVRGAPPAPAPPPPDKSGKVKAELIAVKCDVCFEREFAACVYNCPTSAVLRIDPRTYFDELVRIAPKLALVEGVAPGAKTTTRRPRRWLDPLLQLLVLFGSALGGYVLHRQLRPTSWSGPGLWAGVASLVALLLLAAMGLRKRLRTQRLGSLAAWAKAHAALGGLFFGLVLFHAGYGASAVLTACLLALVALATAVGIGGQLATAVVPRRLARSEDEAVLPEDVAPRVEALLQGNEQFLSAVSPAARKKIEAQVERLAPGGLSLLRSGTSPRQIPALLEKRAKRLPALEPGEHAVALRVAENLAHARLLLVRRRVETLLIAWVPVHLVASALALMLLVGHLMTVILW